MEFPKILESTLSNIVGTAQIRLNRQTGGQIMLRGRVILGCNSDTEEPQEKPHLIWTLQLPGKYLNLKEQKIVTFCSIIYIYKTEKIINSINFISYICNYKKFYIGKAGENFKIQYNDHISKIKIKMASPKSNFSKHNDIDKYIDITVHTYFKNTFYLSIYLYQCPSNYC